MNDFKVGDLVYIPSEVVMFNETTTLKLNMPINLLITGSKDGHYEVFFENNKWLVKQNNVYKAE
jgi:uncharacterized protein (DUF302 family)